MMRDGDIVLLQHVPGLWKYRWAAKGSNWVVVTAHDQVAKDLVAWYPDARVEARRCDMTPFVEGDTLL